jgi:hypothetical protein
MTVAELIEELQKLPSAAQRMEAVMLIATDYNYESEILSVEVTQKTKYNRAKGRWETTGHDYVQLS